MKQSETSSGMTEEQKKELRNLIETLYGQDYLLYAQNEIDNKVDKFISQAVKEEKERIARELAVIIEWVNNQEYYDFEISNLIEKLEELKTNQQ